MPATSASLTFTPLTNPIIWFASVEAFNSWFGAITVSIDSENLPDATTTAAGAVLMATVATYAPAVVVPTWVTIATDEGSTNVPSQQAYTDLQAKVDAMGVALLALQTAMVTAGQLDLT